jgi:hypothetical protein
VTVTHTVIAWRINLEGTPQISDAGFIIWRMGDAAKTNAEFENAGSVVHHDFIDRSDSFL